MNLNGGPRSSPGAALTIPGPAGGPGQELKIIEFLNASGNSLACQSQLDSITVNFKSNLNSPGLNLNFSAPGPGPASQPAVTRSLSYSDCRRRRRRH